MPGVFGRLAQALPPAGSVPEPIDSARAATIVKGLARRIGAGRVGVCRVNPAWAYSHRGEIFYGNWDDGGREIPQPLPFAVVIATEMDHGNVGAGPHTPALFESAFNYGQGAFITTILSLWFAAMGYRAVAQHSRRYDVSTVNAGSRDRRGSGSPFQRRSNTDLSNSLKKTRHIADLASRMLSFHFSQDLKNAKGAFNASIKLINIKVFVRGMVVLISVGIRD
jgi:hypothetical protein